MSSAVKNELQVKADAGPDDHKINELAKKMAEQNRAKMAATYPVQMARPRHPVIQGQVRGSGRRENGVAEEKQIDDESRKGRFGWCEFEKNVIPYFFRNKSEKFTSVRMAERELLNRFLAVLPPEVLACISVLSYYVTHAECKLLNEINLKHADCHFGMEAFTSKDMVARLSDAKEFYHFLALCHKKLVLKRSDSNDRCGFFRINGESAVPYIVAGSTKFVPLFYFEGETDLLKLKSKTADGWNLVSCFLLHSYPSLVNRQW